MNPCKRICPTYFSLSPREKLLKGAEMIGVALSVIALIGGILGILASRGISCGPLNAVANHWGLGINSALIAGGVVLNTLIYLRSECKKTPPPKIAAPLDLQEQSSNPLGLTPEEASHPLAPTREETALIVSWRQRDGDHCPSNSHITRTVLLNETSQKYELLTVCRGNNLKQCTQFSITYTGCLPPEKKKNHLAQIPQGSFDLKDVEKDLHTPSVIKIEECEYRLRLYGSKEKPLYVIFFHPLGDSEPDYVAFWEASDSDEWIDRHSDKFKNRTALDAIASKGLNAKKVDEIAPNTYVRFEFLYRNQPMYGIVFRNGEGKQYRYAPTSLDLNQIIKKDFKSLQRVGETLYFEKEPSAV